MGVRACKLAFGMGLVLLLATPRGFAQQEPAEPGPEQAEAAAPQPIPLADVPARLAELDDALALVRGRLKDDSTVAGVAEDLEELEASAPEKAERTRALLSARPTPVALGDLLASWQTRRRNLDGLAERLSDRVRALEEDLADLEQRRAVWGRTLEAARAAGAPGSVVARIREALGRIAEQREREGERRARLFSLQGRVARQTAVASRALDEIEAVRQDLAGLLRSDAPPLWSMTPPERSLAERLGDYWSLQREVLTEFALSRRDGLVALLLFYAAALAAALALRNRVRALPDDQLGSAPARALLERPFSIALLAVLLFSTVPLAQAPSAVVNLRLLLSLVPVLRLLPLLAAEAYHRPILALVLLTALDTLRALAEALPLLERALLFVEGAVGAGVATVALAAGRRAAPRAPLLAAASYATVALLGAALVANVLGFASFARVLASGTVRSLYLAGILYGTVLVAGAALEIALGTAGARSITLLRHGGRAIHGWAMRGIALGAVLWWSVATLDRFRLYEPAEAALRPLLEFSVQIGDLKLALSDVLAFSVVLAVVLIASRATSSVLEQDVLPRMRLGRGVPAAIASLTRYGLIVVGALLAFAAAGLDFSRFALIAGALGVGVGFGLQNVVNNFVSGLILLFERPIRVGDTIESAGLLGEVTRIGMRSSTVRTFQGSEVIVPNGNLISEQVINWTLSDQHRRLELPVGVAYGTDPERVLQLLYDTAKSHPDVLPSPEPWALFTGFGDSSLDFEIRFWAHYSKGLSTKSAVAVRVNAALRDAGITIPFPQRDVHVREPS